MASLQMANFAFLKRQNAFAPWVLRDAATEFEWTILSSTEITGQKRGGKKQFPEQKKKGEKKTI